ncbi:hypothetical protein BDM02DRAFT_2074223 [Thelephora ganbajun]|uniref:Uncharacterized protein n=1 Tax=Thelephora ganbajun TaxID=370292 RepID=A0ACB6ZHZ1_THEGA|nr:hypothetical protein BDM02DRAFT_2074223 [Thelephora ganbajun]
MMLPLQQATSREAKIDSLPEHILTDIFSVLTFSSNESRLYAPDILSHVSSRWRAIALNATALWTFVVVTFPVVAGQIARARAGLSRSRDRPIDVYIDVRDPDWNWESDEGQDRMRSVFVVEIMQWLEPSHHRWRSLTVLTDTWTPMHTFLSYSTMFSSLPELERLSLTRCNAFAGLPDAPDPVPSHPVELFGGNANLPKLRHVTLSGAHVDYSCTGFKGLLSLDLRHQARRVSPTTRQLRQLLHASPELKTLSLVALNPNLEEPEQDGPTVSLAHLTDLTLGWWFVEDAVKLLEVLQLPVVENIVLEDIAPTLLQHSYIARDSTPILDTLVKMGNRPYDPAAPSSFPSHLRRVMINGVLLDPVAFSRFIPFLVNVEELELKSVQPDLVQAVGHNEGILGTEREGSSVASVILRLR